MEFDDLLPEDLAIATHDLTRRFGDTLAVDHLTLHVPRRSVYAFLGPNGAGKSTTIRMLLGLIRPTEGTVHLLGEPLESSRRHLLRSVGTLVEAPSLYGHLTGRENLQVTGRILGLGKADIDHVLGIVRLKADAHRLVRTYSMGMRQRLGIALALLGDPALLILDEPTNGLDPAGIQETRALIRRLPEIAGATVFVSSHLLGEVERMASHVGIIHQGRLLFEGTLAALRARQAPLLRLGVKPLAAARRVLQADGLEPKIAEESHLLVPSGSDAETARLVTLLVQHGIDVYHASLAESSLEATFLALTEHALPEPAAV